MPGGVRSARTWFSLRVKVSLAASISQYLSDAPRSQKLHFLGFKKNCAGFTNVYFKAYWLHLNHKGQMCVRMFTVQSHEALLHTIMQAWARLLISLPIYVFKVVFGLPIAFLTSLEGFVSEMKPILLPRRIPQ